VDHNPESGTNLYYPACTIERLYAYHGINAYVAAEDYKPNLSSSTQNVVATENAFRHIWQEGVIYSNERREQMDDNASSSMIFGLDAAAGDGSYVFMNVCKPHSAGEKGYNLVFDPYTLVEHGALVGLDDLQGIYMDIATSMGLEAAPRGLDWTPGQAGKFLAEAEWAQEIWRASGGEATRWLEWLQGLREEFPLSPELLRWYERHAGDWKYRSIQWMTQSQESALDRAEVLMPDELSLDLLTGVIFRRDYYDIEDFVEAYGPPGTEPPPALDFYEARIIEDKAGNPIRCPRCGGWFVHPPLVIDRQPWGMRDRFKVPGREYGVYGTVCQSCGAVFHREHMKGLVEDEYLGQKDELEQERW